MARWSGRYYIRHSDEEAILEYILRGRNTAITHYRSYWRHYFTGYFQAIWYDAFSIIVTRQLLMRELRNNDACPSASQSSPIIKRARIFWYLNNQYSLVSGQVAIHRLMRPSRWNTLFLHHSNNHRRTSIGDKKQYKILKVGRRHCTLALLAIS